MLPLSRFYTVNTTEAQRNPNPEPLTLTLLLVGLVQRSPRAILPLQFSSISETNATVRSCFKKLQQVVWNF